MPAQSIEYTFEGTTHIGHLAVPERGGTGPAVLLAHEGPGLDDHLRGRADRLAGLGYTAFALDYHGGPMEIGAAFERLGVLAGDDALTQRLGQAGLDVLLAQPDVDASRVAAMGYCFGGALVMQLARTGVPLGAVIGFHASLPPGTVEANRRIDGRVLMCMGTADPIVSAEDRHAFEAAMIEAETVQWGMELYGGVGHTFTNPEADVLGMPGIAFDAFADARSWRSALDLLDGTIGRP
jgi:dienelactone hydrolase